MASASGMLPESPAHGGNASSSAAAPPAPPPLPAAGMMPPGPPGVYGVYSVLAPADSVSSAPDLPAPPPPPMFGNVDVAPGQDSLPLGPPVLARADSVAAAPADHDAPLPPPELGPDGLPLELPVMTRGNGIFQGLGPENKSHYVYDVQPKNGVYGTVRESTGPGVYRPGTVGYWLQKMGRLHVDEVVQYAVPDDFVDDGAATAAGEEGGEGVGAEGGEAGGAGLADAFLDGYSGLGADHDASGSPLL
eukprot:tig00020912_g15856.t1